MIRWALYWNRIGRCWNWLLFVQIDGRVWVYNPFRFNTPPCTDLQTWEAWREAA